MASARLLAFALMSPDPLTVADKSSASMSRASMFPEPLMTSAADSTTPEISKSPLPDTDPENAFPSTPLAKMSPDPATKAADSFGEPVRTTISAFVENDPDAEMTSRPPWTRPSISAKMFLSAVTRQKGSADGSHSILIEPRPSSSSKLSTAMLRVSTTPASDTPPPPDTTFPFTITTPLFDPEIVTFDDPLVEKKSKIPTFISLYGRRAALDSPHDTFLLATPQSSAPSSKRRSLAPLFTFLLHGGLEAGPVCMLGNQKGGSQHAIHCRPRSGRRWRNVLTGPMLPPRPKKIHGQN